MRPVWSQLLGGLALLPALVHSLASTDSLQDTDPPQSGYLPNHNMNPAVVGSSNFVISWKQVYNANELFFAKPIVYTPVGASHELVITASSQNIIRIIDGLSGALVNSRTLDPPFQSVDSDCSDIPNTVGITGTPILDPTTNIMYFFSKGYKGAVVGPAGTINGQYKFYAVNIPSLTDVPGFPVSVEGNYAANDHTRYFVGGTVLQRPGLATIGNSVVAGFGGHCDNFNYTGMLVAVSKTAGVGVTNVIAMEAQPGAPSPQALDITVQNGGKAGIWQSGMGIAADASNNRIFFVTGNARGAGDNGDKIPASGKTPISTLEQVVADFTVNPSTGVLTQADYFEPYEYDNLNGGDQDFGSSGVALLDPGTFFGTGVNRIAVAGGKSGKIYILNADNLGGYAMGANQQDLVIQTIFTGVSLFSGIGSYPLEGGYIYLNPTGAALYAYSFSRDGSGKPVFTLAGTSARTFAGKSVPTVTTNNGQPGTGIVWMADGNYGLVAYQAIPVNGVLVPITVPTTGGLTKDQRAVFGNGRVYVSHMQTLIAVGGPAAAATSSSSTHSSAASSSTSTTHSSTTSSSSSTSTTHSSTTSSSSTSTTHSSTTSSSSTSTTHSSTTSSSSTSTTSTSTSHSSTTAAASTTTTSHTTTPSLTSAMAPTAYPLVGCFLDTLSGPHALPLLFANDSMTPQLCAAYVQSLANAPTPTVLPYFAVEYHRECYGGSVFNYGTTTATSLSASQCTDVCSGYIGAATTGTAFCGGANMFNLYASNGIVQFPGQPATTFSYSHSSTSVSSSSSTTTTSHTSTSTGPSSNTARTTSSSNPTTTSTTSASATASGGYEYIGCYEDKSTGHALPLLFANDSMTPELCGAYVKSLATAPTPTILPYYYLEYHRECYGGSSFNFAGSAVTSLSGSKACTDVCSGSMGATKTGTAFCGGPQQFDLYAANGVVNFSGPLPTQSSTSAVPLPTPSDTYNWNIGWVAAAPDGFKRPFIGINGQWPNPVLNVNVGDVIRINVQNNLGNESTAIHWHGLHNKGMNQMDGPAMVNQCPIPPGASFVYEFQVNQTGTYWYHAHIGGQYMDGLRGPLVVHDPAPPYGAVDQEIVMTLSDLYHGEAPTLLNSYQSSDNEDNNNGAEPVPDATLINEAQNVHFNIVPGKTYLFRIISMAAFASHWLQFDQHELTVVEIDGVYTQPYNVSQLFVTAAQRYSVIVKAKATNAQNFAIVSSMDQTMFNPLVIPADMQSTVTAWLVYDSTKTLPSPFTLTPASFDDTVFLPHDQEPIFGPVTYSIALTADFGANDQDQERGYFNGISYTPQKVPTLYTLLSSPANLVSNPTIYGVNSNPFVIPYGAVVEVTIQNHDSNAHPFHLHGHNFQVVDRVGGGLLFPGISNPDPPVPMRRDTILVYSNAYATIRFVADNPGVNLFHCHIEWHVEGGLTATFIEAPDHVQAAALNIPDSHKASCAALNIPMVGNAAGNSNNWLDLTGANTDPPLHDYGALVNPPTT